MLNITIRSDIASWTRCIANRHCFTHVHVRRYVVVVFEEILLTTSTTSTTVRKNIVTITIRSDIASWTRCIANRQCFAHVRRIAVLAFGEILLTTITTTLNS